MSQPVYLVRPRSSTIVLKGGRALLDDAVPSDDYKPSVLVLNIADYLPQNDAKLLYFLPNTSQSWGIHTTIQRVVLNAFNNETGGHPSVDFIISTIDEVAKAFHASPRLILDCRDWDGKVETFYRDVLSPRSKEPKTLTICVNNIQRDDFQILVEHYAKQPSHCIEQIFFPLCEPKKGPLIVVDNDIDLDKDDALTSLCNVLPSLDTFRQLSLVLPDDLMLRPTDTPQQHEFYHAVVKRFANLKALANKGSKTLRNVVGGLGNLPEMNAANVIIQAYPGSVDREALLGQYLVHQMQIERIPVLET